MSGPKRKVLLLNPPAPQLVLRDFCCSESSKANYYWPPIDLVVLSGILHQQFEVQVLDANVLRLGWADALRQVMEQHPEVVISLTGAVSVEGDMAFLQALKARLPCQLLVIGDIAYFEPRFLMTTYPFVDGIIFEFASRETVRYLHGERDKLKDLAVRSNGQIEVGQLNPDRVVSYPTPRHELFPLHAYGLPWARHRPITTVLTSYGCPFKCTYCPSGMLQFRWRDLDEFTEEWRYIGRLGIREVFVRDFTFNLDRRRQEEVCHRILESGVRLAWSCEARPDNLDEAMVRLMRRAGCHTIMLGVETASDDLLRETQRKVTSSRTVEAFRLCRRAGVRTLGHFILGLPGETAEAMERTIALSKRIGCDYASFNLYVPRLGTILRKRLVEAERIRADDLSNLDCSVEAAALSAVPPAALQRLHRKALRAFYLRPAYLLCALFGVRSRWQLFNLLKNGMGVLKQIWPSRRDGRPPVLPDGDGLRRG